MSNEPTDPTRPPAPDPTPQPPGQPESSAAATDPAITEAPDAPLDSTAPRTTSPAAADPEGPPAGEPEASATPPPVTTPLPADPAPVADPAAPPADPTTAEPTDAAHPPATESEAAESPTAAPESPPPAEFGAPGAGPVSPWAAPQPVGVTSEAVAPPGADYSGSVPVVVIPDGPPPPTHLYPPAWDGGGPAEPRPRKSRRKLWLSLLAAGVAAVLLVVGYTAVRFMIDLGAYDDGHSAYERADCAAAVAEFDSVINGWRMVTFGDTVRRAESEKAECLVFREAADRQQDGNAPGALAAYARFVPDRPASPLTDAARTRVAELFGGTDPAALATLESCDALDVLRNEKMLVTDSAPGYHAACGAAYAQAHQTAKAVTTYARLFTDYGDHKVAAETEAKIAGDTAWCLELDRVRADAVLSVRGGLLAGLLATCATAQTTPDSVARKNAEEFLQKYPGHARTTEVLGALARLINKGAREVAGANDLGQADPVRSVGGNEAVIMVYNDSDEPLTVAFSGPQPRVETIDACPSCTLKPASDNICRDQAVGKRIVVAAGEYDVAFTSGDTSTVKDAFAHWTLQPGKEYFSCVGSYQPA